jgi:mannose-6-phosphate isomerase-like protein (cupin superfamily)
MIRRRTQERTRERTMKRTRKMTRKGTRKKTRKRTRKRRSKRTRERTRQNRRLLKITHLETQCKHQASFSNQLHFVFEFYFVCKNIITYLTQIYNYNLAN